MTKKVLFGLLFLSVTVFACQEKSSTEQVQNTIQNVDEAPADATTKDADAKAQQPETDPQAAPTMEFDAVEYNFGSVTEGTKVKHVFKFKNGGNAPLIISDATTPCGCTVPKYPRNVPIQPGQSEEITVEFDSNGKSGSQVREVTFATNIKGGTAAVRLVGNVEKVEAINGPYKK